MTSAWDRIDEDYRNYLERSGYLADDFNSPSFDRAKAFNNFDQFKQRQAATSAAAQLEKPSPLERFKSLLEQGGKKASEPVMRLLVAHYAASIPLVLDAAGAADLYERAALIPQTTTEIALRQQGISVNQPFSSGDPSKALLLHANKSGYAQILKLSDATSTSREVEVMNQIRDGAAENNLVVFEEVEFSEQTNLTVTDRSGSVTGSKARVRSGLLMKHYQGTLSQIKIPLPDEVLLKYGRQLEKALRHMHSCGYCHLDVKPSNIFIFEGSCFLGDYGAARRTGSEVFQVTRSYYPSDFPVEAEPRTDFLLLSKTLLEMHGQIESPVKPMSSNEIRTTIENVQAEPVRSFLRSFFL